jgi:hypothetical protein
VAYVPVGQIEVDEPANGVHATLGGQVELVGFDLWREQDGQWLPMAESASIAAGDRLKIRLVWRALTEVDQDYTAFVHLRDSDGTLWAQHDEQPQGGGYPTSYWRQGELVVDEHEFVVAEAVAGAAELSAGMYLLETMERLGEAVFLQQLEVKP